ncbi:MAG: efflux RND transporter permease subunit [Deltaproteobacteria bacterium]|nr:efflux RND transporter permease subunit [Deltaproteobacteria bacterium]
MSDSEDTLSPASPKEPLLSRIIDLFLKGDLAPLLILLSLLGGAVALYATPREEEPQIVVPLADVIVEAPGLPAEEVERLVATPLEKLLYQIDGVEYVYSMSMPGRAVITVRFYVGEDREDSLVKIYNKIHSNTDRVPAAVSSWVVKPLEIDDVPIMIVTLWSDRPEELDDYALRRIAEELEIELQSVPRTNRVRALGGRPRAVRVELDTEALAARGISPLEIAWALEVSNRRERAGSFDRNDRSIPVDAGDFIEGVEGLRQLVVGVVDGSPVFLRDVASIVDGPAEATGYSWIGFGPAENGAEGADSLGEGFFPAVHVAVAKQKGANAVRVARAVEERLAELEETLLPEGVHARVTRNYGETANEKVNELVEALVVAILIVVGLIAYALGWREALVVAVAVPITFSLVLLLNLLAGYTINRVTLFALILSLGLVVDDPIVDVENIYRHLRMRAEPALDAVKTAVNEVRPPILLATFAVIVSFLPMLFITGMMGPYMRPMAINVPLAMFMSMVVAFMITPWLAYRALREHAGAGEAGPAPRVEDSRLYRAYAWVLEPMLARRRNAWALLGVMSLLFGVAILLGAWRMVPLKMLPFDNKAEFQVLLNGPEGMTLERTDAVLRALAEELRAAPEVRDFQLYTGFASPMDFNGMVRHYFLRRAPELAEIRVRLVGKRAREMQSHAIVVRLRDRLEAIADQHGVRLALVEVPPGPPVLSTIVGEIYGEPQVPYARLREAALVLAERLEREPLVSDVDTSVEADRERLLFVTDQEKAALSGVATEDVTRTLSLALAGLDATQLHVPGEANPLPVRLRVARAERSGDEHLSALTLKGRPGVTKLREGGGLRDAPIPLVRMGELGELRSLPAEKTIYHKNLERVAYVYADTVGRAPAEAIVDVQADELPPGSAAATGASVAARPLAARSYFANGGGDPWSLPAGTRVVWTGEGEWKITVDVFRDLGIAFGAALVGIYLLLVYQTGSYAMPLILMISIPLTMIGIMPGFWLLNLLAGGEVGGYPDPVFFTATAMIGMIALAGIAVRNAILLIEFVHVALAGGMSLRDALLRAGAVRTRAIVLTAGTAMLAAIPITLDPIFSGLAWALIFGLSVSTVFTLFVVPVTYDLVYRDRPGHGLRLEDARELSP